MEEILSEVVSIDKNHVTIKTYKKISEGVELPMPSDKYEEDGTKKINKTKVELITLENKNYYNLSGLDLLKVKFTTKSKTQSPPCNQLFFKNDGSDAPEPVEE